MLVYQRVKHQLSLGSPFLSQTPGGNSSHPFFTHQAASVLPHGWPWRVATRLRAQGHGVKGLRRRIRETRSSWAMHGADISLVLNIQKKTKWLGPWFCEKLTIALFLMKRFFPSPLTTYPMENPSCVDHFPWETMGISVCCLCSHQGTYNSGCLCHPLKKIGLAIKLA